MRERLTACVAALTLVLVGVAFIARSGFIVHQLRAHASDDLNSRARVAAVAVDERIAAGQSVDEAFLRRLVDDRTELVYHPAGGASITVRSPQFDDSVQQASSDDLWASADTTGGTVVLVLDDHALDGIVTPSPREVVALFVLLALLAGLAGFVLARWLARPFRQLAEAAAALGRGRFHLDLPRSRMREVQAIGSALATSSQELEARLGREQEFAEHASHALRTPLTALRLDLEDLGLRDDLPGTAVAVIDRSVRRIDQLDGVAHELVALSRSTPLSGARVGVEELARLTARQWSEELAGRDREVTVDVEGDRAATYVPGPVEQILDLLLLAVLAGTRGDVRLCLGGADDHLRILLRWAYGSVRSAADRDSALVRARAVATALGGRLDADSARGLVVRLPRR